MNYQANLMLNDHRLNYHIPSQHNRLENSIANFQAPYPVKDLITV